MKEILNKIQELRKKDSSNFKILGEYIKDLDEEKYNYIIFRLKKQIEIVEKYKPKVRPAIDPMVSMELGVYRRLDDYELGKLLNYPECCIKSFAEDFRIGIDSEHLKEAEEIKEKFSNAYAIILPSGFIPCSLKCEKSWKRNLIAVVTEEEYYKILELERKLKEKLPHFHGAYDEYYEKIILK
ncbi:DUF483 domain-containing protein [Methanotorris igneus]|uniref:DUF483 domain-containing protein n=1 Tax=Methanotorris igneus (strain DSM 5666 / JCM 11834 / Kol 5) TaxID=880724 RepID=F6BDK1_METIK|nr:DUF483 domain-containing protein [Methanotorris igneus]AEF96562.1 protein of unknown function DUF483 [Methanotorris igneus Kol 5]